MFPILDQCITCFYNFKSIGNCYQRRVLNFDGFVKSPTAALRFILALLNPQRLFNWGVLVRRNFYPPFFWRDGGFHWGLPHLPRRQELSYWGGIINYSNGKLPWLPL
jgi:hypothetical protein